MATEITHSPIQRALRHANSHFPTIGPGSGLQRRGSVWVPTYPIRRGTAITPPPSDIFDDWDDTIQNTTISGDLTIPEGQAWLIGEDVVVEGHVFVDGRMGLRPGSYLKQTVPGFDPEAFVGGGMAYDPTQHSNDYGIWCRTHGILDWRGTEKVSWIGSRYDLANPLAIPASWDEDNDEMWASPVARDVYEPVRWFKNDPIPRMAIPAGKAVDVFVAIAAANGIPTTIRDEWIANGIPAEIMNVTRDAKVEGPGHIHMHSHQPQLIEYVEIENMGVSSNAFAGPVLGRYALHWHHGQNHSRGSFCRGVSIHNTASRGFVPHDSHGIDFFDCVGVNLGAEGFWWDRADFTHDVLVDHLCISGVFNTFVGQSRHVAISLGKGFNMRMRNNRASGARNNKLCSGFDWESGVFPEAWEFAVLNISHNNAGPATRLWNNQSAQHMQENFISYRHKGNGVEAGAYRNNNRYRNALLLDEAAGDFGAYVQRTSAKNATWPASMGGGDTQRHVNLYIEARTGPCVVLRGHNLSGEDHEYAEYYDCVFVGSPKVLIAQTSTRPQNRFIRCGLTPDDVVFESLTLPSQENAKIEIINPDGSGWLIRKISNTKVVTTL